MKIIVKIAAIGIILGLAACARPAKDMQVQDPYAGGAGAGAGGVGASALPGTAEYFKANVGDTINRNTGETSDLLGDGQIGIRRGREIKAAGN